MKTASLFVVLMMVLAACGGGSPEGGGDNGGGDREFDRCTLMTAEEAEQWLGSPVDEVEPADLPVGADSTCSYRSTSNERSILIQVDDGEFYFAEEGSGARGPETISGLGEDAHTDGTYVAFLKDGWSVRVSQIQGAMTQAQLEEIAHLIESRLP